VEHICFTRRVFSGSHHRHYTDQQVNLNIVLLYLDIFYFVSDCHGA